MLEDLEAQLTNISQDASLHTVTRIAALAALEIVGKYYALTDDCEVYRIAIVMCPDKKMEWFNRNDGWVEADRKEADRIVRLRWSESYAPKVSPTTQATVDAPAPPAKVNRWASKREAPQGVSLNPDSIEAYLAAPPVSAAEITLSEADDFLSAPASSVDAERAFSNGRLQLNHLQHQTSSQTFKARVALGSWIGTPLMPSSKDAVQIMEKKLRRGKKTTGEQSVTKKSAKTSKGKGKEKAKEVVEVHDSDVEMGTDNELED
ncbi:hypothetical protein R3P38DRAFT_1887885 [Favolaschia claudopus]|uniref:HAT C-terminal dimerisation domain-containing protein n=1 Tax=Favolaschia claudopus TaxID=2862362 RepID=A0AAW0A1X8_9AGAR